jgi:hypothetical protein
VLAIPLSAICGQARCFYTKLSIVISRANPKGMGQVPDSRVSYFVSKKTVHAMLLVEFRDS